MPNPTRYPGLFAIGALLALACGGGSSPESASPKKPDEPLPVEPLATAPLAGQSVAVTPITLVVATDSISQIPPLTDRTLTLAWADSIIAAKLTGRAPDVKWVLPAELRRVARRAPTVAPDPDRMGQSLMRSPDLQEIPDPFRGNIRNLVALVGGRFVLVPAALSFTSAPSGQIRAELSIAMGDTRTGQVAWRTIAWADGPTPARALALAMEAVLPVGL